MPPRSGQFVLFVDDDRAATRALIRSLGAAPGYKTLEAESATAAVHAANQSRPQAAVVDLSIDPDRGPQSGLELISELVAGDPTMRVIVLTGYGAETWGVKALHAGAASFLVKPVDPVHLQALITDSITQSDLKRSMVRAGAGGARSVKGLQSESPAMAAVLENVELAAAGNQPVLIAGETGTGKSVIARSIHQLSARGKAKGPFIAYQPRFGSPDLVSSELFGHQKGAFTGANENRRGLVEEAEKGTLFLDEVDELPPETQVLLLGVLQEGTFRRLGLNREIKADFRLITATNLPLEQVRSGGKVRGDFFHRISHVVIELPPLRERMEDLAGFAESFLRAVVEREKLSVAGFSAGAFAAMQRYSWPGNIRELQAAVERAVHRAQFKSRLFVEAEDLALAARGRGKESTNGSDGRFRERVRGFELQLIREALGRCNNNQSDAAKMLGLDRSTLRRLLERGK